ncbi:MAG: hypothetical protein GWP31_05500, partial [Bacteroidetes bacterium]|nr:hypothetical protein [Bacteroidota bacterium]
RVMDLIQLLDKSFLNHIVHPYKIRAHRAIGRSVRNTSRITLWMNWLCHRLLKTRLILTIARYLMQIVKPLEIGAKP